MARTTTKTTTTKATTKKAATPKAATPKAATPKAATPKAATPKAASGMEVSAAALALLASLDAANAEAAELASVRVEDITREGGDIVALRELMAVIGRPLAPRGRPSSHALAIFAAQYGRDYDKSTNVVIPAYRVHEVDGTVREITAAAVRDYVGSTGNRGRISHADKVRAARAVGVVVE